MSGMPLFKGGWSTYTASCMSPCMLNSHYTAGSPNSLIYCMHTELARSQDIIQQSFILCMWAHSRLRNHLLDPVSRLWEHCLPGPFSRLWETASLSCPDIWVREPDCLHLPYTGSLTSLETLPHHPVLCPNPTYFTFKCSAWPCRHWSLWPLLCANHVPSCLCHVVSSD